MPSNRYATNTETMTDRGKGEVEAPRFFSSRFEKMRREACGAGAVQPLRLRGSKDVRLAKFLFFLRFT
jgi:hypothetical protein